LKIRQFAAVWHHLCSTVRKKTSGDKDELMSIQDLFKQIETARAPAGKPEYLIAGLGNPGKEYENTRHNAGFLAIDHVAEKLGVKLDRAKYDALCADAVIDGCRVLLMKPQTYMNASGEAVIAAMRFYHIEPKDLLVIYDDMDVEIGSIKVRKKGGPGTHNGAKSVVHELVSEDFLRIRVGIGKPVDEYDAIDYVIGQVEEETYEKLAEGIHKAADAVEEFLKNGIEIAMNKYN